MKPFNLFIILALIVVLGGFAFFKDVFNQSSQDSSSISSSEVSVDRIGYLDYSENNKVQAQEYGKTALFFHAGWCPTCVQLDKEIKERITEIPKDLTILKVDYDNDKVMRNKYKVTAQHTLVVLNESRDEIRRWQGGNLDLLLQEVRKT